MNNKNKDSNVAQESATEALKSGLEAATHFDVVISGGGPTGLLTAIGLKTECPSLSVAIVEPMENANSATKTIKSNFDQRCLALSYGSLQLLEHWAVWPELKAHGWPIKSIVTSERGHIGKTVMRAEDYQLSAMGQVASMHNLGCALKSVAKLHDITWFCPDKIESLSLETESFAGADRNADAYKNDNLKVGCDADTAQTTRKITLTSGVTIRSSLLIVAEGANSTTRALLNIDSNTSAYGQSAVIANVKVAGAKTKLTKQFDQANHVAFERFTLNGPIAFLPIGEQEYNVVWTQTPEQAADVTSLTDEAFCQRLQAEFGFAAGQITNVSKRATYPLSLTRVERLTAPGAVLLGNTAHTVHPIAGQGFNLGVRDIGVLVFAIKQALRSDSITDSTTNSIGRFEVLNHYEQNRVADIDRIVTFTDLLVRMFGLKGRTAALTRTTGLMALQSSDTLQQWLALHFMGSHQQFNLAKEKLHD